MIQFFDANLEKVATAYVGCKLRDDGVKFPESLSRLDDSLKHSLFYHFFGCFTNQKELFELSHEMDIDLNLCQDACERIFKDSDQFIDGTQNLAKILYETLTHLKREPRLIVAYYKGIVLDGVVTDAIGIYLMKKNEVLLDFNDDDDIIAQNGTVVNKAALIFNIKGKINGGFLTAIYEDNDTIGWKDEFLNVKLVENEYSLTRYFISLIKNFIGNEMPKMFDVGAHDKANFLYRTDLFFKERDNFDMQDFANEVFVQPEIVEEFSKHIKEECNDAYTLEFKIDQQAYKEKKRTLTSKMTVGDVQLIFKGEPVLEDKQDDKGKFYVIREKINNDI